MKTKSWVAAITIMITIGSPFVCFSEGNPRLQVLLGEYGQAMFVDTTLYPSEGGRDFYMLSMCGDGSDGIYMIPNTAPRGLYHWKSGEDDIRLVLPLTEYHHAYEAFDGFDAVILTPEQIQENQDYIWLLIEEDGILYGIAPGRGRLMRFTGDGWDEAGIIDFSNESWTAKPQYFYSSTTRYPFVKMGNYLYFLQTTETSTPDSRNLAVCDLRTGECTVFPHEFAEISAYKPGKLLVVQDRLYGRKYSIFNLDEMRLEEPTLTMPGNTYDFGTFSVYDRFHDRVLIVDNEDVFATKDLRNLQPVGVMPAAVLVDYIPAAALSNNLLCVAGNDEMYVCSTDLAIYPGKTVHIYDITSLDMDHGQYIMKHPDKPVARPRGTGLYRSVEPFLSPTEYLGDGRMLFGKYSSAAISKGAKDIDVYENSLEWMASIDLCVDLSSAPGLKKIVEGLDSEIQTKLVVDGKILAVPSTPNCKYYYFVNPNSENVDAAIHYIAYMVSRQFGL